MAGGLVLQRVTPVSSNMFPGVSANDLSHQGAVSLTISFKVGDVEYSGIHLCVKSACFFMTGKLLG